MHPWATPGRRGRRATAGVVATSGPPRGEWWYAAQRRQGRGPAIGTGGAHSWGDIPPRLPPLPSGETLRSGRSPPEGGCGGCSSRCCCLSEDVPHASVAPTRSPTPEGCVPSMQMRRHWRSRQGWSWIPQSPCRYMLASAGPTAAGDLRLAGPTARSDRSVEHSAPVLHEERIHTTVSPIPIRLATTPTSPPTLRCAAPVVEPIKNRPFHTCNGRQNQ